MTERTYPRVEGDPRVVVPAPPRTAGAYERVVKPVLDRAVALVLLLVLLPVFAIVAAGVLVTLGRPILYRQTRVGFEGEPFTMLKFRSMRHDRRTEERNRGYDGPDRRRRHKTPNDPRHTDFGRLIRRYSLDELPQLWNVVRGELSLVGPRPELPRVVARYEPWQHARHAVRPGVTGLWQVTERDHDGEMHKHVDVDLRYVHALSPRVDAWIALWTLPAVLLGTQARLPWFLLRDHGDGDTVAVPQRPLRTADEASVA